MTHNKAVLWISTAFVLGGSLGYLFNARFCQVSIGRRADTKFELKENLQRLFQNNAYWMREALVNTLSKSPVAPAILGNVERTQKDLVQAFEPYYGSLFARSFATLLANYTQRMVDALNTRNDATAQEWRQAATNIVSFVCDANPSCNEHELKNLFMRDVDNLKAIAAARTAHDWQSDINTSNTLIENSIKIADALYRATVTQFPQRF